MSRADILGEIADAARLRVEREKQADPPEELIRRVKSMPVDRSFPFEAALRRPGLSLICEIKRASPSKGLIAPEFPYRDIAKEYERGGAAAISVLTEPKWFLGSLEYLRRIAKEVSVPVLRKDFVVDSYMIWQAKEAGAAAILLICAILDDERLAEYLSLAHSLGLSALVEVHDEGEIARAKAAGARVIGVNNRDLRTFTVDVARSARLRALIGPPVLFVSESGITGRADIEALEESGADAALIGETLMRAPDKAAKLAELMGK